jgi:hypothetical protein
MLVSERETINRGDDGHPACKLGRGRLAMLFAFAAAAFFAAAVSAQASGYGSGACSKTARAGKNACKHEVTDDWWEAVGICTNESDFADLWECFSDAWADRRESREECGEVFEARLELCEDLGEDPYDPDFDPADFDSDFTNLTNPNPYRPLAIGNQWIYEGGDEVITVDVTSATKLIEGVTCIVVNDIVEEDGEVIEDTNDWEAQAKDGSVHYCGEIALNFETFDGDDPEVPELVDIEGSWKAGRDGAKSGILMQAEPEVGQVYRLEWAFGDAEDAAEVLSTDYSFGDDAELDEFVPEDLAALLCDDDCLVTRDFTPLDPGARERKYYAPGIGVFLEVDPDSGDIAQLVDCNVDPKCALLPAP